MHGRRWRGGFLCSGRRGSVRAHGRRVRPGLEPLFPGTGGVLPARQRGVPVPQIAQKLVITSGKNKGQRPSVATVYRILTEPKAAS